MSATDLEPGRRRALLLAIVVAGLAPRLYHLGWGLPEFLFFDSRFYYLRPAYGLVWEGVWAPNTLIHTPLFGWLLALLYLPWATFGAASPPVGSEEILLLEWMGRILTLLFAVGSIPVVYAIGRRLLGTRAALFAATAFAFTPLPALEAHRPNADLPMVFLALLAVHQAVRARQEDSVGRLLAAFGLAGLTAAMKLPGLAIVMVPAWVALTAEGRSWSEKLRVLFSGGVLTALVLCVVVLPVLFGGGGEGVATSSGFQADFLRGRRGDNIVGVGWWFQRYVYWFVAGFPYLMGWSVYVAGLLGFAWLAATRNAAFSVVAMAAVPFFLVQGAAGTVATRYCLLIVPWFAIAAGFALDQLCAHWRQAGAAIAGLVLLYAMLLTTSICLRVGAGTEQQVRATIDEMAAASGRPLQVAYPWRGWLRWDAVGKALKGAAVQFVDMPARFALSGPNREATVGNYAQWLIDEKIDVVLFPAQEELMHVREGFEGPQGAFLEALNAGTVGFRQVAAYRTPFFTESWYLWSDPALDHQLPVGINGYRIFAPKGDVG